MTEVSHTHSYSPINSKKSHSLDTRKRGLTLGDNQFPKNKLTSTKTLSTSSRRRISSPHPSSHISPSRSKRKTASKSNAEERFPPRTVTDPELSRRERRKEKAKSEGLPKTSRVKKRGSSKERKKSKTKTNKRRSHKSFDNSESVGRIRRQVKSVDFSFLHSGKASELPLPNALVQHGWLSKPIGDFLETLKTFLQNEKSRKVFVEGGGFVLLLFHLRDGDTETQVTIIKILATYINYKEVYNSLYQNVSAMWSVFNELHIKFRNKIAAKCKLYYLFVKLLQTAKNTTDTNMHDDLIKCFDYYNYKTDEVHRFQHLVQGLKHEPTSEFKLIILQIINIMISTGDFEVRLGLRSELASIGFLEVLQKLNSPEFEKEKKVFYSLQNSDKVKYETQLQNLGSSLITSENPYDQTTILETLNKTLSNHPRIQAVFYDLARSLLKLRTDDVVGVSQWQIVCQLVTMCAEKETDSASNRKDIEKLLRSKLDGEKYLLHSVAERVEEKRILESTDETETTDKDTSIDHETESQIRERLQNQTLKLHYAEHELAEMRRDILQLKKEKNELKEQLTRSIQRLCDGAKVNHSAQVHFSQMMEEKERDLQEVKLHNVLRTKKLEQTEAQLAYVTNSFLEFRQRANETIDGAQKKILELTESEMMLKKIVQKQDTKEGNVEQKTMLNKVSTPRRKLNDGEALLDDKEREIEELKKQLQNHAKQLCDSDKYIRQIQRNVSETLEGKDREIKLLTLSLKKYIDPNSFKEQTDKFYSPSRRKSLPVVKTTDQTIHPNTARKFFLTISNPSNNNKINSTPKTVYSETSSTS